MPDTKLNINVNMKGKEYMEYKKSKRLFNKPLSKNTKKALPYFILCGVGILIITLLIQDLTYKSPEPTSWQKLAPDAIKMSWSNIGKMIVVNYAPLIIICVGIAWVLHGFGFLIIKG